MTNMLLGKYAPITNLGLLLLLIPIILLTQNIYFIIIGMALPCIHYFLWGREEDKIQSLEKVE